MEVHSGPVVSWCIQDLWFGVDIYDQSCDVLIKSVSSMFQRPTSDSGGRVLSEALPGGELAHT